MSKRRAFVYGTMILFISNLFNRVLAFVYQYLVMTWVGAEAYGLYQMVFPTYIMALVITTAGLPLAVSKMVSEQAALGNRAAAQKIFRTALAMLIFSGVVVASAVFTLIPYLTGPLFPDPRVFPIFIICIPALLIVAVSSAYRGYFQGLQEMRPTALAQVMEQITRVIVGLGLAVKLLPRGIEFGAIGLAVGMVSGELAGLILTLLLYRSFHKKKPHPVSPEPPGTPSIIKQLFQLGLPITLGRLVSSGTSAADSILIPLRLQAAGYTLHETTALYGQLGGAAISLLTFPSVFTLSLSTSIVPAISEAIAQKQSVSVRYRISESLRLTVLIGVPFLVFLYFFAPELCAIFRSPEAGAVLSVLALAGIFLYLQNTTAGILQGLGFPQIPVFNLVLASLLKLILIYHLTAIPSLGLVGTAWSYDAGFLLATVLNFVAIIQKTGLSLDVQKLILQPLSAGSLMGCALYFIKSFYSLSHLLLMIPFITGIIIYLLTLWLNRGLGKEDLRRIPVIGRFVSI